MLKSMDTMDSMPGENTHLRRIESLLKDRPSLFPCIRDLVENGVSGTAYADAGYKPSRQEITHYLAKWLRSVGVSQIDCQEWLIEYALDVLSAISSTSLSQIRHSTKAIARYVYRSEVEFDCWKEENVVRGLCRGDCPVYGVILNSKRKERVPVPDESFEAEQDATEPEEKSVGVRELYREQFEQAMGFVREQQANGLPTRRIVRLLNDKGFKTRTGKQWSVSILGNELRRIGGDERGLVD
jgi:hypothetical protein